MARPEFGFSAPEMQLLLGHEAAEQDDGLRLKECFFQSTTYEELNDGSRLRVLVAHKGVGKSALLRVSYLNQQERGEPAIWVAPADIVDIPVSAVAPFVSKVEEWKLGLRRAILSHILTDFVYIVEPQLTRRAVNSVTSTRMPLRDLFNDGGTLAAILPPLLLAKVRPLVNGIITIYFDDLDLGWQYGAGTKTDIERLATLFQALREMGSDQNLHFRAAIRSDIYYLMNRAYVDVGKLRTDTRWYRWDNKTILAMVAKRIVTYRRFHLGEPENLDLKYDEDRLLEMSNGKLGTYLTFLMDPLFTIDGSFGRESVYKVLLTLIRKRPRDLVFLLTKAAELMRARVAGSSQIRPQLNRILPVDIAKSLSVYSQHIMNDTVVEYQGEFPAILSLLQNMAPTKDEIQKGRGFVFKTQELLGKLNSLIANGQLRLDDRLGQPATLLAGMPVRDVTPLQLLELLYRINFIVVRVPVRPNVVRREYFDESKFDIAGLAPDNETEWEIHPAYRWVLHPNPVTDDQVFKGIVLGED